MSGGRAVCKRNALRIILKTLVLCVRLPGQRRLAPA